MNRPGHESPNVLGRLLVIKVRVHTSPTTGRVSRANFTIDTYLGFKGMSQCRSPSMVTTSSGRRIEVSLFVAMEESRDIDCGVWVTAYGGVGITICNMFNSLCRSCSERRRSRAVCFLRS